ncbi:DUF3365 domain-containing protein [Zobellia galactanivorans]|uniref:Cytochrome c domain-containing protein n=1 Tax=Zobellia galactanivorans (strain DSM 12802 / CCUG 47099 / CIP 106680 / NCIMB 13871 / Dsij) TaxID=63186 RepID=G0L140_ZOBGA|nr:MULTISPECIES: DUF3365 domain-containing protein [Zobellia]MBU3024148.1 DUF3365 domain-containing protein [Zobellia galactanivorans]MDO6809731.1 DUF3365 domain-containing protein [Zobellia galactanivorans]OWW23654.1 hypothetical protein B4Q04_19390 [Zobellia sp. OII3]CAZ97624.1 Conserved hypothetical protein [Zobellia galactanivorans]
MKKYCIYLLVVLFFASCKDGQKTKTEPVDDNGQTQTVEAKEPHPGKLIMERECYMCHDPKATMANRIAPPMEAIKRHYIDSTVSKEEFTEALIKWVNDPETETKIPAAHKRFGPMPYLPNRDEAVAQIADYIYDNELERPDGFDDYFKMAHKKGMGMEECHCFDYPDPDKVYASIGMSYAKEAQMQLGKSLTKAIQEKGPVGAIGFCNLEAIKITDSVSLMKNAVIQRVSDRPRNPKNKASAQELEYIASFKEALASGEEVSPVVHTENDEVSFYAPIVTNALCLQCHGKPNEQVLPETMAALKKLYPNDKAVGYDVDQVRGMWSIAFYGDK